ncbi:hypothetical protein LSUE1_G005558 [Lachnellula suecica]|uniref:BTB domain-containing protein n=1 Tax=Lachnellula suecica TaxID=602035 RepID=A0A8T9C7G3_9HELO|nr:hypothetical protein LSUE1_G005558 [Lachnellula suecica]
MVTLLKKPGAPRKLLAPMPPPPPADPPEVAASINIDGKAYSVVEVRTTGDVILDVSFENSSACNKSIPSEDIRKWRNSKSPIPSPRIFYRVRLETLKKNSRYFQHLLGPTFAEGVAITNTFAQLAKLNLKPAEVEADRLPRIKIVEEDVATKTIGRETIFCDMLRIIHGADHLTKPITLNCLTVLVVMADRYNTLPLVARYVQRTFINFKYPVTLDKKAEETLRQKILIFYHTDQAIRFASATKELILRGSSRWLGADETATDFQTAWWDLPDGLEAELAHRRACVLRTIASVQTQCLALYTSKDRQCKLGYDSSGACDSFQLGEMIKFLSKKELLCLIPFQAASPYDQDYIWPDAYPGDIETLIGLLRQCPSYQINQYHSHCGLRTKLLPALDYIKSCIETGVGVKFGRSKSDWVNDSWSKSSATGEKKAFWVSGADGEEVDVAGKKTEIFDFKEVKGKAGWGVNDIGGEKAAKALFLAERWNWIREQDSEFRMLKSTPNLTM